MFAVSLCVGNTAAQLQYGENQRGTTKDSDVVSRAFPDVESIELLSPAFLNPDSTPPGWVNGTDGPTSDTEMGIFNQPASRTMLSLTRSLDYFYRSIADRNDWLTYQAAEFLSEEGRPITYLFLSSSSSEQQNSTKLKVYIQGAIHGDEPAGDQGIMALIGRMDRNQSWTTSLLERMDIKILPRYNTDGVSYFQRQIASNLDGNRDHIKLDRRMSRDIKQTFSDWSPHISVDCHEFGAPSIYGGRYQSGLDAMISGGINLNIHQDMRRMLENLFIAGMGEAMEARSLRWGPYVTGSTNETVGSPIEFEEAVTEARTGRNAYGLTQTISFLLEMRGISIANQHFQRRVATALTLLETILNIAHDNSEEVYRTIEDARTDFIESDDDIVVTDSYPEVDGQTWTMVDRRNGSVVEVPITFYRSTPSEVNLTRSRPEAYLIPRTYADIVERLEILGLEVETLQYEYRGTVEALNITSLELDDEIYEGRVLSTVTTSPYERAIHLPSGSYWVSTRQKNAALAFIALEPENIDSYITFGIIYVEEGGEYPIFRVMT